MLFFLFLNNFPLIKLDCRFIDSKIVNVERPLYTLLYMRHWQQKIFLLDIAVVTIRLSSLLKSFY